MGSAARGCDRRIDRRVRGAGHRGGSADASPRTRPVGASRRLLALLVLVSQASCGFAASPMPTAAPTATATEAPAATPATTATPAVGSIEPAPGSGSTVYPPNPGAIVVAIDAGHGGCLDWGVPDPSERGVDLAEKTLTLAIARRLGDRLAAEGIGVVMIRDDDSALAGDNEPSYGCDGPAWRDVDGNGRSGFEPTGRIRTRDELQARIDLANLVGADAFVSIHINALTQDGVVYEIAATQTFYDDETLWGDASAELAGAVQDGVVAAIDPLAQHYDRQDRGIDAVSYFVISRRWSGETDTCEAPGDTWCRPHRALVMPGVLAEVGSITLRQEHDLLASAAGQEAVAGGLFEGLAAFLAQRRLAARIALEGTVPGGRPPTVDGDGPPFRAQPLPAGPTRLRLTNTGSESWPADIELVAGWQASDLPYLPVAPDSLESMPAAVPALAPGESVVVEVDLRRSPRDRSVVWVSVRGGGELFSDLGSPALQLALEGS